MATIFQVKEALTPSFMSISGVVGVGISMLRNTIVVYVSEITDEIIASIPKEIEGYKIEILKTGRFEALKW